MAYLNPEDLPSSDDLLLRYPEFTDLVTVDQIDLAIEDASLFVDDTWLERDIQPAIVHLAAHYLAVGQMASSSTSSGGGGGIIASESIGRISVSYVNGISGGASKDDWMTSQYGIRFNEFFLRNRNHVAIV